MDGWEALRWVEHLDYKHALPMEGRVLWEDLLRMTPKERKDEVGAEVVAQLRGWFEQAGEPLLSADEEY